MKLQVLQEDFAKNLSLAARFASPKAQLPILGNVLLSVKKNRLFLLATNLETSIATSLGAQVEKVGDITIPARTLSEIVSNMPKGNITIETSKEKLTITTEGTSSNVLGMHPGDFPEIPQAPDANSLSFPTEGFTDSLSKVVFSASVDETRPVLTGVLLRFEKNSLSFVATDGFRLSRKTIPITKVVDQDEVILPKNALIELTRTLSTSDEVSLSFPKKESLAIFSMGDIVLSSRLIQGEFPVFEKIIPRSNEIVVNLDKGEFLRAVKLASVFARDSANVVKILVKKGSIELSSESAQSGNQEVSVDASVEGLEKDVTVAFNYKFIEDFLSVVKGESVVMKFSDENTAGIFLDPEDENYLHLIMPVKL